MLTTLLLIALVLFVLALRRQIWASLPPPRCPFWVPIDTHALPRGREGADGSTQARLPVSVGKAGRNGRAGRAAGQRDTRRIVNRVATKTGRATRQRVAARH